MGERLKYFWFFFYFQIKSHKDNHSQGTDSFPDDQEPWQKRWFRNIPRLKWNLDLGDLNLESDGNEGSSSQESKFKSEEYSSSEESVYNSLEENSNYEQSGFESEEDSNSVSFNSSGEDYSSEYSQHSFPSFPASPFSTFSHPYSIISSIVHLQPDAAQTAQSELGALAQLLENSRLGSFFSDLLQLVKMQKELQQVDTVLTRLHDFNESSRPLDSTNALNGATGDKPTSVQNQGLKEKLNAQYDQAIQEILADKIQNIASEQESKLVNLENRAQEHLSRIIDMGKQRQADILKQMESQEEFLNKKLSEMDAEMQHIEEALDQKSTTIDARVKSMQKALTDKKDEVENRLMKLKNNLTEKLATRKSATSAVPSPENQNPSREIPGATTEPSESPVPNSEISTDEVNDIQTVPPVKRSSRIIRKKSKSTPPMKIKDSLNQ